jgi:hypothetical protein
MIRMHHTIRNCLGFLLPVLLLCGLAGRSQNIPPQYADTLARLKAAGPEKRAQMQTGLMNLRLALTAEQYRQVSAINLMYARKIEPILRSDDGRFTKYGKIKPLLEEKDGKLKAVFTPDQFKRYQDIKQEPMSQARKAMSE